MLESKLLFASNSHWRRCAVALFTATALSCVIAVSVIGCNSGTAGRSGTLDTGQLTELPVLSALPAFSFTDQDRQTFGSEQLSGKPWVANFVFTSCTTVCPTFVAAMRRLKARMRSTEGQLNWVSFSVDPETDTPSVLKEYATRLDADSPDWRFLTGPDEEIRTIVVEGFKSSLAPDPNQAGNILHGSHFVLVDRQLRLRGYYGANDPEALERLVVDARRLSSESAPQQ